MRRAPQLHVTHDEHMQLQHWAKGRRTPVRLALRAKIILLAAEGHDNHDIATAVQHLLLEKGPSVADVTVHIEPESED